MQNMKRSKYKLAASVLTVIAMVFTLVPWMGTDVAKAAEGDRTAVDGPAQMRNPIDKVFFEERSDGNYDVYVHFDPSLYDKPSYKPIKNWVVLDGETGNVHTGWGAQTVADNDYTMKISTTAWPYVAPGETISLAAGAYYETYQDAGETEYRWVWLDSGKYYALVGKRDFTAPTPGGLKEEFSGFKVALAYDGNGSYAGIDAEYVSYKGESPGGDYTRDDLWFREDNAEGTLQLIQEDSTPHGIIGYDSPPYLDREYTYYVVKKPVLQKNSDISKLASLAKGTKHTLSNAEREALKSISAHAAVKTPEPVVDSANNLTIQTGVKKATLYWGGKGDETFTGYEVKKYASGGSLLETDRYIPQYKNSAGFKTYAIPYVGTYYFQVTPYYVYNGKTYYGAATAKVPCTSKQIAAASGSVTKISNKIAKITINRAPDSTGTKVYQYANGKWNYLGKTARDSYTVKKKAAGKKKYKLLSYIVDNGKTYDADRSSKQLSPKANVKTYNYSNRPAAYDRLSHYWRPNKIYYSGKKVVVKGKFINTHIYDMSYFKIKLTVKCQGKVIGTKIINSGKLKSNQVKKMTVKLNKSKAGYDLRAGYVSWSYKIIKYK